MPWRVNPFIKAAEISRQTCARTISTVPIMGYRLWAEVKGEKLLVPPYNSDCLSHVACWRCVMDQVASDMIGVDDCDCYSWVDLPLDPVAILAHLRAHRTDLVESLCSHNHNGNDGLIDHEKALDAVTRWFAHVVEANGQVVIC